MISLHLPPSSSSSKTSMASRYLFLYILLVFTLLQAKNSNSQTSSNMFPLPCTITTTCEASLYHINHNSSREQIASFYSINTSQLTPIYHGDAMDYLIRVPCTCDEINGTRAYFYNATYFVEKQNETFSDVSSRVYSGQAWAIGDEETTFQVNRNHTMNLLCGCVENKAQIVVSYTVQNRDTLSSISSLLTADVDAIQRLNSKLIQNQDLNFIDSDWVLFVPMEKNGIPVPGKRGRRRHEWTIVVGILLTVTLLSMIALIVILLRRKKSGKNIGKNPKMASKTFSYANNRGFSFQSQLHKEYMEDVTGIESDRPVVFSIEEIENATDDFEESKIIGRGGYGSVYFGVLGDREVAIKKMRSNKSKEFFAELKVLCKVHHINVVELLGYASGDDYLYLVYEYVRNGSLSEHLHDPVLKGLEPLTWTTRTQIALDAAKGIEYIHDHTKARYVHRDIKTSNILLDVGLRAKVADFGLAKLVERTSEEEMIATRLVGTPGYLPPESVKVLQLTSKTDVFAFGVVLAELITGQRALSRDNKEPNKMKSLINLVHNIFQDEEPEVALEEVIDGNLRGSYPLEDVYRMAEIAEWCLSEDAVNRPEMRDIVVTLSQIVMNSIEWEASLGGNSQVFSGLFNGR